MKRRTSRQAAASGTVDIPAEFWKTFSLEEFNRFIDNGGVFNDDQHRRLADMLDRLGRHSEALEVRALAAGLQPRSQAAPDSK